MILVDHGAQVVGSRRVGDPGDDTRDLGAAAPLVEGPGDPDRLRQVLLNLLSNAAKFAYEGGCIAIRGYDGPEDSYVIEVEDRGIGIAPDQLSRVLQPFHQASDSYTRSTGGTGLGLAIVDSLVELHGGRVEVESEKDVGTLVRVSFPRAAAGLEDAGTELRDDPSAEAEVLGTVPARDRAVGG